MSFSLLGFEIALPVVMLGVITGFTYGLLAVGLVLVYRSSRIINFAHGEIGSFAAALVGLSVTSGGVPYWIAFPFALAIGAGVGALSEVIVVRRLRNAPVIMSVIATLGLSQFILLFSVAVNTAVLEIEYEQPHPPWLPEFAIGALRVTPEHSAILFLAPIVVFGLALFLRRSRHGLAIRAAAANAEASRMVGVFAARMSTLAWAIAGAISAFTAVLLLPTRATRVGTGAAESLGPSLMLRALAVGVLARMVSLPMALGMGIVVGVVEQLLQWNNPAGGGQVEMALFLIVMLALLVQRRVGGRSEEKGSWLAVQPWRPLPEAFRRIFVIRNLGRIAGALALAFALTLPLFVTNATALILINIIAFGLVGLSVGLVTGLAGELTLGQFALAGVGAAASYWIARSTGSFPVGFLGAGLAAAAVSLVIGLPALRIRGLMLAVTTLGFALASSSWLLQQPWMLSSGVDPGRSIVGSRVVFTGKGYYVVALAVLAFGLWLVGNVRRGGIGLRLRALRDNEEAGRAFTIPATRVRLQGFMLGGFVAGLGGALYGHALGTLSSSAFPATASISVAAMTVLGGIGILAGPLLGALYIIGIPQFLPLDNAALAASALGWLVLILYFPGGIAQLIGRVRRPLVDLLARRGGLDPVAVRAEAEGLPSATVEPIMVASALSRAALPVAPADGSILLEVRDLRKRFGGVRAVDGVSFAVPARQTLGVIGPNGAGKTTLFELIGGFSRPDEGQVIFNGRDVTRLGPETRGRMGVIRSFQDAMLFPTLSVLESVTLAQERAEPTRFFASAVGLHRPERRKRERAGEIVEIMGLHPYRNKQIAELSTGTRRITELACLVALEPTVLLLDEPSSGIAQRETEALGELLGRLKLSMGVTLVVIEHDIPLIMALSDRIIAMASGQLIADGPPEIVRKDSAVVESYLGGDARAIERSELLIPTAALGNGRCAGITLSGDPCSRDAGPDGMCAEHRSPAGAAR